MVQEIMNLWDVKKETMHIKLSLKQDKSNLVAFSSVLHHGFQVKTRVGSSIKNLLCGQFNVAEDYLVRRIQTIFIDGKPVDDEETAIVRDGSTVALSIALGGLLGATLRKGGLLAGFRSTITHQEEGTTPNTCVEGIVTIKLFNQLASELGPMFLKKGIWLKKDDAESILKNRFDILRSFLLGVEKDGREITQDQLATLNWSEAPKIVTLKAFSRS
jgi:hypothetical protein